MTAASNITTDASSLTLVVSGWVGLPGEPHLIVEKEGRAANDIAKGRDEGWADTEYRINIPELPNWRHITQHVHDFERLKEFDDTFSVRPGGHGQMPDFWTFGTNFPIVSRRLRARLEEAFPEGCYFIHCPVYERLVEIEPSEDQIELTERARGGHWAITRRRIILTGLSGTRCCSRSRRPGRSHGTFYRNTLPRRICTQ